MAKKEYSLASVSIFISVSQNTDTLKILQHFFVHDIIIEC